MISQCPQCHIRLTDFAVACDKCGWSIVDTAANTVNGNNNGNGSAAAEIEPLAPGEDPPIVIVKKVAKTMPPPVSYTHLTLPTIYSV